ncbi:hypothetical protein L0156_08620 [bacterium]|nr:hypothetical protein [bacterium]
MSEVNIPLRIASWITGFARILPMKHYLVAVDVTTVMTVGQTMHMASSWQGRTSINFDSREKRHLNPAQQNL